jgi:hypothetical protein
VGRTDLNLNDPSDSTGEGIPIKVEDDPSEAIGNNQIHVSDLCLLSINSHVSWHLFLGFALAASWWKLS